MVDASLTGRPDRLGGLSPQDGLETRITYSAFTSFIDMAVVATAFLLLSGLFANLAGQHLDNAYSAMQSVSALLAFMICLCLAATKPPMALIRTVTASLPLVLFSGLIVVSILWSNNHFATIKHLIPYVFSVLSIVLLVASVSWNDLARGIMLALMIALGLSILNIPIKGIEPEGPYAGAIRGVWGDKNAFGQSLAFGAAWSIVTTMMTRQKIWLIGLPLFLGALVFTMSKTALMTAFLGVFLVIFLEFLRGKPVTSILAIWSIIPVAALIGTLVALNAEDIMGSMGRDLTFTGRTTIWTPAIDTLKDSPWIGFGYGAFWEKETGYLAYIYRYASFEPAHAHNAAVETALAVGLIGVGLLALMIIQGIFMGFYHFGASNGGRFILSIIPMIAVTGFSESILPYSCNISFALLLILLTKAAAAKKTDPYLETQKSRSIQPA